MAKTTTRGDHARERAAKALPDPHPAAGLVDLAGSLAEARTLDELERSYLDGIRRVIPLPAAGIYLIDDQHGRPWRSAAFGLSEFFLTRYERVGRAQDPVFAEVVRTRRPVCSRWLMSDDARRALPMYRDVAGLYRMSVCIQAPVLAGSKLIGTLNFGGADGTPLPDGERMALLAPLGRLVGAAVTSTLARREEERRHEHVIAALSLSDEAVVITDVSTGERTVNDTARRVLDRMDDRCSDQLDRLMSAGTSTLPEIRAEQVTLRDGHRATLQVRVAATSRHPDIVVSFLRLVDPRAGVAGGGVERWLTARERAVADRVALGMRDSEIAEELHLSQHTVRDHVKSIYRKTGATNRVTLTRLMLLGQMRNGVSAARD